MTSLVERLRERSDRRPTYNLDSSDEEDYLAQENPKGPVKRYVREDAKDDLCQSCGEGEGLIECQTCTYAYHPKCLRPKLKAPYPGDWKCPECVSPLSEIEKILEYEVRPMVVDDIDASKIGSKQVFVKQYHLKWKGLSYLHCSWVPEQEFINAYKSLPRLKIKVNNFHRQMESMNGSEDFVAIRPEWTTVDRILACRGEDDEKEYFVKWKDLPYDECYWELESDISAFQPEIERFKIIQSRHRKKSFSKETASVRDAKESQSKRNEFQHYEKSPEFLTGGTLHPYQLEGLNFLRFSWSKQTHVILADEMGLGKTIQSIAFLASLFDEVTGPHLVVAPLSTLRNWEREFATWAPQMNVVMYFGSSQARSTIREYEFYYPKSSKKTKKKKKFGVSSNESKQNRIKFDVLLTSYEMINLDTVSLKAIKWECMIVDEGHRLKNKESKLFFQLTQFSTRHRVLLTGTPLQNNLDELFMLMHFLDDKKFGSLEEFQEEFKDINHEEQISRLHTILAPHLLRRMKKDVMKELPPKMELIMRVELSSKQKEYYRAILTRNYELLARKAGHISLNNVVMELRKLCCHPYMLDGVEKHIPDVNESHKELLETSGKLQLLDKMMVKLREQGHRVLIYSQFQNMLDILEDYLTFKKWQYERIDGKVSGTERQIRIDRFNAKNSSRFCFILSTRAGGLGLNLATADTVIIYDSDWNPHADLQAMARAHRLGQTNKVMIYRLVARGTVEERMMELTKKKMILEHLVVGNLKKESLNQEELDDIIRYGSMELFAEETEESKARQIHYDDDAIDRLLDREHVKNEEASLNEDEEEGFLKAFKVANFEFVDESAKEENQNAGMENKTTVNNSDGSSYWEELLKDKYEVHKSEEINSLGKGKRVRKQMVSVEDDDLAGLEDVSSDGGDDNYEADSSDDEAPLNGRKSNRKRSRVDGVEQQPLMEGEGRSLRVLGFNQSQRATFVQIIMRFGVGDFDWTEFVSRLKGKTYEEVDEYATLFLSHIDEGLNDLPNFSDGVPKEGLRVEEVLTRIGQLSLIYEKVKLLTESPDAPLFEDDTLDLYPGLRDGRFWKTESDCVLLRALLKHGYGRWQTIADDKDLRIQQVICRELNIPVVSIPSSGAETTLGAAEINNLLCQYREMQRRQVDFIKKRVLLLEKGLFAEYYEVHCAEEEEEEEREREREREREKEKEKEKEKARLEAENTPKREDAQNVTSVAEIMNHLPPVEMIAEEASRAPAANGSDKLELTQLYNKMCMLVEDSADKFAQGCVEEKSSGDLGRKILPEMEKISSGVNRILSVGMDVDNATSNEAVKKDDGGEDIIVLDD